MDPASCSLLADKGCCGSESQCATGTFQAVGSSPAWHADTAPILWVAGSTMMTLAGLGTFESPVARGTHYRRQGAVRQGLAIPLVSLKSSAWPPLGDYEGSEGHFHADDPNVHPQLADPLPT